MCSSDLEIEKQTDYLFVYNVNEVNLKRNVKVNAQNKSVAEVLNKVFEGTDIYYAMEFYEYPDGSGYEGRFTKCGICVLMKELGLYDLTPALCRLDYTMSEAGGVTNFVRQYTLASGGPYCDCGYKKKG